MTTSEEVPSYYQISEFDEYQSFFDENQLAIKNMDIKTFVDSLNYIISENEKVCDMYAFIVMLNSKLPDIGQILFKYLNHNSLMIKGFKSKEQPFRNFNIFGVYEIANIPVYFLKTSCDCVLITHLFLNSL